MGERNRLSGTLSIQNRLNQIIAAIRFWKPWIISIVVSGYLAGFWWIINQQSLTTVWFYIRFRAQSFSNSLAQKYPEYSAKLSGLADLLAPTQAVQNFIENGGTESELQALITNIDQYLFRLHMATVVAFIALCVLAYIYARWEAKEQTEDKFIRGARLLSAKELTRLLKKAYGEGTLKISNVVIPKKIENLSFFVIGKPQQGKTVLINSILTEIQHRQERAVVFCAKREDFVTTHYRPMIDGIFCPPDLRSLGWSLKHDIKTIEDFSVLANVLSPSNPQAKDPMWDKGKRMAVEALFKHWWLATDRSNRELGRIAKLSHPEMAKILKDTPGVEDAHGLIANTKSQTAYSFYVNILTDLQPLQLLAKNDGDFSITQWLQSGTGCIFLPCSDRLEAMLAPIYGMFIELVAINHMDLPQDRLRRIWYLMDELPAISKISKLPSLLNKGPSYGVAAVIGSQSVVQLDSRYGEQDRRAILNSCATSVIYCVEDDKTAEEMSKRIGQSETEKAKENLSTASVDSRDGVTVMAEYKKDYVISPDQLRNLSALTCYVRVAGFGTADKIKINPVSYPTLNADFVPNPEYSLQALEQEYHRKMQEQGNLGMQRAKAKELAATAELEQAVEPAQSQDDYSVQMIIDQTDTQEHQNQM
ncbi:MAG: type IV secretion system DNA-binding domain-containing protein [Desulfuromonadaceae bacterium]|nr:type IV secretion system DNA-binding domain-containing protein [Desulfuromonadaceae bacterium]